jgi:hypothetical protein
MDDADRQRFIETLGEVCAKTDWQVHAYVLCRIISIGWSRHRSPIWSPG